MGAVLARGVRRLRALHPRLRDRHGGALARRTPGVALSSPPTTACARAHLPRRHRGAEEEVPARRWPRARRSGCWGLTENSAGLRRRRHADHGGARRRRLGAQRLQDVHHQRPDRGHRGGHGGHRPAPRARRASPPSSSSAGRRASAPARRRTSSASAPPTPPSWCSRTAASPPRTSSARRATGFIDTLRILDRGRIGIAALSLGHRAGRLEASHELRQGAAGSSATPSPSSRPSSSRSPTWPPRWTRRACSPGARRRCATAGRSTPWSPRWPSSSRARSRSRWRSRPSDPRRLRLHQGLPGRALPARLQARHHRRGHERGPAPGDRARAAAGCSRMVR